MCAFADSTLSSRRDFLKICVATGGFSTLLSAGWQDEIREFMIDAVDWIPTNALTSLALGIASESGLEYIDARCHQCNIAIRIAKLVMGVATALGAISCPQCLAVLDATVIVSAELWRRFNALGFTRAVGTAQHDGRFTVAKVGPLVTKNNSISVTCAAVRSVFLDSSSVQQVQRIDNLDCYKPKQVFYVSRVKGVIRQRLLHVWRRDGYETDRIPFHEPVQGDHYSYKTDPTSGLYVVTTQTETGAILDSRAFTVTHSDKARTIKAA